MILNLDSYLTIEIISDWKPLPNTKLVLVLFNNEGEERDQVIYEENMIIENIHSPDDEDGQAIQKDIIQEKYRDVQEYYRGNKGCGNGDDDEGYSGSEEEIEYKVVEEGQELKEIPMITNPNYDYSEKVHQRILLQNQTEYNRFCTFDIETNQEIHNLSFRLTRKEGKKRLSY